MSSVFQIDYSFLKKDISQERKKKKYFTSCKILCQESKMVHTISKKALLFCVADEFKIDSLTNWNTEILECRKKKRYYLFQQGRL